MGKFGEAQQKMDESKKKLDSMFVEAEIENGAVKVKMNGNRKLTDLTIAPSLLEDKDALEDLLITAINKASDKAEALNMQEMQGMAGEMIPGLSQLLGK